MCQINLIFGCQQMRGTSNSPVLFENLITTLPPNDLIILITTLSAEVRSESTSTNAPARRKDFPSRTHSLMAPFCPGDKMTEPVSAVSEPVSAVSEPVHVVSDRLRDAGAACVAVRRRVPPRAAIPRQISPAAALFSRGRVGAEVPPLGGGVAPLDGGRHRSLGHPLLQDFNRGGPSPVEFRVRRRGALC